MRYSTTADVRDGDGLVRLTRDRQASVRESRRILSGDDDGDDDDGDSDSDGDVEATQIGPG